MLGEGVEYDLGFAHRSESCEHKEDLLCVDNKVAFEKNGSRQKQVAKCGAGGENSRRIDTLMVDKCVKRMSYVQACSEFCFGGNMC